MTEISTVGAVDAPAETVFDYLADLRTHWELTGGRVRLLDPEADSARRGGQVRIRGPLGIGRSAATEVVRAERPDLLEGRALIGRRTEAAVRWSIERTRPEVARVSLSARVVRAGLLDRVILASGGRLWLERLFGSVLARLAAHPALVSRPPQDGQAREPAAVAAPSGG